MPVALPIAIALLSEAASASPSYGPAAPIKVAPAKPPVKTADDNCATPPLTADTREIFVCAPKPQGYRLNPDVLEAKRERRNGGRPHNPHETYRDNSCATIGPMGCRGVGAGIDLMAAASTVVAMVNTAVTGGNVGKMFVTDPTPSEYQLYLEAKKRREAKEAEAAAAAKTKAAAQPAP